MLIAPLPANETERLAALHEYGILGGDPDDAYDDLARLAAFICGTPYAAVTLL
ncbi:MAG: sensory box histidine kinase/response regulator, partial [Capsulimonas sp.]|nr:sensory box histidine kinase/response regulator [Capsulimonas sp.]